jgi:hypothetical protein
MSEYKLAEGIIALSLGRGGMGEARACRKTPRRLTMPTSAVGLMTGRETLISTRCGENPLRQAASEAYSD